jgi:plasmid maintenance system antidote protein VapI
MKHGLQKKLAEKIGMSPVQLNAILNKREGCPKRWALILEKETGIDKTIWIFGTKEEIQKALSKKYD